MTTTTTTAKPTTTPKTATPCLCSCGQAAKIGSIFLPGHDAKLKGYLQRDIRDTQRDTDPALKRIAQAFESDTAKAIASEMGWDHLMTPLKAKAPKVAKPPTGKAKVAKKAANTGRNAASKTTKRKVGRWTREGVVSGETFTFENAQGDAIHVPLAKTKAA